MNRLMRVAAGLVALAVTTVVAATTVERADPAWQRAAPSGPTKCVSDSPSRDGRLIFRELRTLRARVWMGGLSWGQAAPTRPAAPRSPDDAAYVWPADLDRAVDAARSYGIEPVLAVNGFPAWANGGRDSTWVPENPLDYGDFMAAAFGDSMCWYQLYEAAPARTGSLDELDQ